MVDKKKRPGERRRRIARKKRKKGKPQFVRPREWIEQELIGVKGWLKRLRGPEGREYPAGWRHGQIKHYAMRKQKLEVELEEALKAEREAKPDPDPPPKAA